MITKTTNVYPEVWVDAAEKLGVRYMLVRRGGGQYILRLYDDTEVLPVLKIDTASTSQQGSGLPHAVPQDKSEPSEAKGVPVQGVMNLYDLLKAAAAPVRAVICAVACVAKFEADAAKMQAARRPIVLTHPALPPGYAIAFGTEAEARDHMPVLDGRLPNMRGLPD
jgi:hypothetical protein